MTGITSYGFYIPTYRIKTEEIAQYWGKSADEIINSLGVTEKSVGALDEDALTMAYASASMAFENIDIEKSSIDGVFVGSESHPYAVNPTSTILAEYLGLGNHYLAFDTQFACKAATGAMIAGFALVKSDMCKNVLISGTDKATGKPGDTLEYSAGSASASFILGKEQVLLEHLYSTSFSSDTPDFWRRNGQMFPSHGGRFTAEPGYFSHISGSVKTLLQETGYKPSDFTHAVFHMPNGRFPTRIASSLGFTADQIKQSLVVKELGNSYTASAFMGLCSILDVAQEGDLILMASYGSGAGSDAFVFKVTKEIEKRRRNVSEAMKNKQYIDYTTYLRYMGIM